MIKFQEAEIKAISQDYNLYLDTMSEKQRLLWLETRKEIELGEDIDFLRIKSPKINIIVFSNASCPECALAINILHRMESLSKYLFLHIIDRDQAADLYHEFMPNGEKRVPVVLFTSEDYYIITSWIERPAKLFAIQLEALQQVRNGSNVQLYDLMTELRAIKHYNNTTATIKELSAELIRAIGVVNYSSRLQTKL